jgi:hypothetical protein
LADFDMLPVKTALLVASADTDAGDHVPARPPSRSARGSR